MLTAGSLSPAAAQISGTFNIPSGTYPTIASAIAALNNVSTGGVGPGGVTFNVAAGHTETLASPTAGLLNITVNQPNSGQPIIFQKAGGGANPKVTAAAGVGTNDYIIGLNGADYVTFNGIDLADAPGNNDVNLKTEFGYALFRRNASDGAQNNTIQNCTVTMNRSVVLANVAVFSPGSLYYGIYSANTDAAATPVSSSAGNGNSNNKFYSNTILNTQSGIYLRGVSGALDQGNDVGGNSASTGNTIQNFGGVSSQTAFGVRLEQQDGITVRFNTIANAANGGVVSPFTLYGINQATGSGYSATVSDNIISLTQGNTTSNFACIYMQAGGAGTLTASNNRFTLAGNSTTTSTTTGGYGLWVGGSFTGGLTINANEMKGTAGTPMSVTTGSNLYFIGLSGTGISTSPGSITNNVMQYVTKAAAGGTVFGISNTLPTGFTGTLTYTGNTISDITLTGATIFTGIDHRNSASQTVIIGQTGAGNTITNITSGGATGVMTGIDADFLTAASKIEGNTISNFSITSGNLSTHVGINTRGSSGTTQSRVLNNTIQNFNVAGGTNGIVLTPPSVGGTSAIVQGNTIKGFTYSSAGGSAAGVRVAGSATGTVVIDNNEIGNFNATGTTGSNSAFGVNVVAFSGVTISATRNKIYDLLAQGTGATVYGYNGTASSSNIHSLSNNLIGDLRTPNSTTVIGVAGIYITQGAGNLYFNTIYLNATSTGSTFGNSGIVYSTNGAFNIANNIVINKSGAQGSSSYLATALRRGAQGTAGTAPITTGSGSISVASNNNLYYVNGCGQGNIYAEGINTNAPTNVMSTLAAYRTFMTGNGGGTREQSAVTEDVAFLSLAGTNANFLHVNPAVATQVSKGGTSSTGIVDDYDALGSRPNPAATNPDIGADEGNFTDAGAMTYASTSQTQQGGTAGVGSSNNATTLVRVVTSGATAPLTLSSLTFALTGDAVYGTDITNAKLYYACGTSFSLTTAPVAQLIPATVLQSGTNLTLTPSSTYSLLPGDNYFFLTFDVTPGATTLRTFRAALTGPSGLVLSGVDRTFTAPASTADRTIVGPLSGVIPVGQGNFYVTLTQVLADLNSFGSTAASGLTFLLTNDAATPYNLTNGETFPLQIDQYPNSSFGLTIKPAATKSPVISGSATAVFALNGADNVTIDGSNNGTTSRNLTISNTNAASGAAVIWLKSLGVGAGATGNTIKNAVLAAGADQSTSNAVNFGIVASAGTVASPSAGVSNNNNTYRNNAITRVRYGIYSLGSTSALNTGTVIADNLIGPAAFGADQIGAAGIVVREDDGATITGNEVRFVGGTLATTSSSSLSNNNGATGIALGTGEGWPAPGNGQFKNATVAGNRVHDVVMERTLGASGITLAGTSSSASNNRLFNNVVYGVRANGIDAFSSTAGIGVYGGNGDLVAYNTVYLSGDLDPAGATTATRSAFALAVTRNTLTAPLANLSVRNNILAVSLTSNTGSLLHGAILVPTATGWGTLDRNDYYFPAANAQARTGAIGTDATGVGASYYTLLADWQAAIADPNSVQVDPDFFSATNLRTVALGLNGVGRGITGINTDIEGNTRLTGAADPTDLGAYEFDPAAVDVRPTALVNPSLIDQCYSASEPLVVTVQNFSTTTALDFTANNLTVTVTPTINGVPQTARTITITSNAGNPGGTPLAVGATRNVTVGSVNMSAMGTYLFDVTATVSGDQVPSNDVLATETRTVTTPSAGTASASPASLCGSGAPTLSLDTYAGGQISWQRATSAGGPFANVSGSTGQNPFTAPSISATTYYRALISCGATSATSNVVQVDVVNAAVTATNSPQARCGDGTLTLTATGSAGTTLYWYNAATGGAPLTALASGTSFLTPTLTGTTTYYVEARQSGGAEAAGRTAPSNYTLGSNQSNYGLVFDALTPFTLNSVDVYRASVLSTSMTVQLRTSTGTVLASTSLTVPAGSTGTSYTVPLGFAVPAQSGLRLVASAVAGSQLVVETPVSFPLNSANGSVSITSGFTGSVAPTSYYYFYNWQLTGTCVSARTAVQAIVDQAPTVASATPSGVLCNGGATGSVTVTAAGGTGTYEFSKDGGTTWVSGANPYAFTGLSAASYDIKVRNSTNALCESATTTVAVTEPAVFGFSTSESDVTCNGAANGKITITATGGSGTYEYAVNSATNYVAMTTNPFTLTGLAPAVYTIRVRTTNGCTAAFQVVSITQPQVLSFTATVTNTCAGSTDGSITVTATGGTPGYEYSIDNGASWQVGNVFNGLADGTYPVLVKDVNNCTSAGQNVTVSPITVATWTGAANNGNWFDLGNWNGCVPSATISAVIPTGLTSYPTISTGTAVALNVTLNGTLTIAGGTLQVHGNWTSFGTFTHTGGAVAFVGATPQTLRGGAFYDLTIGSAGASLTGLVSVQRVLTLTGNLTTNGNRLTLLSTPAMTGMVVNSGGVIVGNLTAQRFIDGAISTVNVTYRHMASPVTTTLSDLATSSPNAYTPRVNPAWNTDTTAAPFPTIFGYDQARVATAPMSPRFVAGYFSPASTADAFGGAGNELRGYSALMADAITPDLVGTAHNGPYAASGLARGPLTNQGWHLLGNPYPGPLDWATVSNGQIPGMNGAIAVLRSTDPTSANYVSYVNGIGAAKYVPMGQAFLMRTAAVGVPGAVSLTNANRVTNYVNPAHYRPANETRPVAKLTLVQSGQSLLNGDETYVYFQNGATAADDQYFDAYKLRSTGLTPSLFTVAGSEELAINGLPVLDPTVETVVPLGVQVGVSGSYKLALAELLNLSGVPVVLRDAVTGTAQDLTQNPLYTFTMDAAFRGPRFVLVFNPQGRVTGLPGLSAAQLAVFPNPVTGQGALQVALSQLPVTVSAVRAELVDALGRVVTTMPLAVRNGEAAAAVDTRALSPGVYVLRLTAGEQTITRRVVLE